MRLSIIVISAILIFSAIGEAQTTWHVPDDFPKIQDAISDGSVVDGDTIIVRPGTYRENIDFLGKAIAVISEQGPDVTIINGKKNGISAVTCQNGEGIDSVLDGFTITDGKSKKGAGMYNFSSNPTVTNCTFTNNRGGSGAGMYNELSSPIVTYCTFSNNKTAYYYGSGGGMENAQSSPKLFNCIFSGNKGNNGAGMSNGSGSPIVSNCIFINNAAKSKFETRGGGMINSGSSITITNCTFFGNSADLGGGLFNTDSNPVVTNCILWNDVPEEIYNEGNSFPDITYSCIQGGYPGTGNINSDPLFVDAVNNDLHLTFPSPCKDAGNNSAVIGRVDLEEDPRIAYGNVDMGMDEFYTHLYYTGDSTPGGIVDIKFVGYPGTVPVYLWAGSGVLEDPIPTTWGEWWNEWWLKFPTIGSISLGAIPSPDGVYTLPVTLTPWIPGPYSIPLQALIGDSLTNLCVIEVE